MATPTPSPAEPRSDALRRFEEAVGFLGHDLDRVSGEMAQIWARLAALERRVAQLESPPPVRPPEGEPGAESGQE